MKVNQGIIAILVTVIIWGTSFIAIKFALADIRPFSLSLFRFLVAYIVLVPFATRQGYRIIHTFQLPYLRLGLTGVALFFTLQNFGVMFTSAGNTALVLGGAPAVITAFAILILKERPTLGQFLGVIFTVIGIALVSLAGINEGYGPAPLIGTIFLLAAIITWGFYTVQGKLIAGNNSALVITTASIGGGLLFLALPALGEILIIGISNVSLGSVLAVLYLGGIGSGLTMFLYNYALKYMDASAAAPFINLTPVVGVICATILGEKTALLQLAGGTIVLFGVWLSNKQMIVSKSTDEVDHHL